MERLEHLNQEERGCVRRYLELIRARLGEDLTQIWLFGSSARGDMWSQKMPMRSDIDLLVLSQNPVPEEVQRDLFDATYGLFLECRRQLAPTFWTLARFAAPEGGKAAEFVARVRREGVQLYP